MVLVLFCAVYDLTMLWQARMQVWHALYCACQAGAGMHMGLRKSR
jgi:hypothetical protein